MAHPEFCRLRTEHHTKKRPRTIPLVILLAAVAVTVSGWGLWHGLNPSHPRFNSLLISVNGEPRNILPGETIAIHATDKVRILDVSTNILLNFGVRLTSNGFKVQALQNKETDISTLLPNRNIFARYRFQVRVVYRKTDLGGIGLDIQPYAEDWLNKANRTIDAARRLKTLQQALEFLPEDSRIWKRLLEEYKSRKMWKQAAAMLEKAVEEHPDPVLLAELLQVYTAMSSRNKVITVLKKLVKLKPDDVALRVRLAKALEESSRYKAAIYQYERIVKQLDKRDRLPIYKRLGYLYSRRKKYKNAISWYLKAAELDRKDANLYYNLSYLYDKIGQKKKSFHYLEKAASLNATDTDSRLALAEHAFRQGDLKKAEKYVLQVLGRKPSSLKALLLQARIAEKQGKKQKLKKIYKKILALDPANTTIRFNLGALNYETGDLNNALSCFLKYIRKYPKDETAREILFDIYKKQKKQKSAFEQAKVLSGLKPKDLEPYRFMFDYLNRKKDYKQMIRIMEAGLKANPGQTELRQWLLFACLKSGKEDMAIKQIRALLKASPDDIRLLLQLARIQEKQEKPREAMKTYRRILNISPDNEEAADAYLRLRLKQVETGGP
ncbi:MAG: hypothetical protein B5M55_03830 [Desulfococcus sp. 4484_242]|nr:MAG: hypothetical protein B5M55_03830 [Desulfococcus sp. 4484_242]